MWSFKDKIESFEFQATSDKLTYSYNYMIST